MNQLTNRPTRSVERWLKEDRASAEFWRGEAFGLCSELGIFECDESDKRDRAGQQLAERLREETQEGSPLRGVDPYAELVAAAIDDVDWYGVAQSLIGYVCNEVGAAYRVDDLNGAVSHEPLNDLTEHTPYTAVSTNGEMTRRKSSDDRPFEL